MKYKVKQFPGKTFETKMDLVRFMKKKRKQLMKLKLQEYKTLSEPVLKDGLFSFRHEPEIEVKTDLVQVKAVINTTNIIDGHLDLHTIDTWNKTVADNKTSFHLKQHENRFEGLISNKALNFNEDINFNQFGLPDFAAKANFNQFIIDRKKNKFMFDKYVNGEVLQHSVGMLYVTLELAYYDEDSEKNMDFFEKAKDQALNPEVADEHGYVWVVSEAKKREGSAVVMGSNSVTPTIWVKDIEPGQPTQKQEPAVVTPKEAGQPLQLRNKGMFNYLTKN